MIAENDTLMRLGVFFEPYSFESNIENYTIYVGKENAKNGTFQDYSSYEDYSSNDYYKRNHMHTIEEFY